MSKMDGLRAMREARYAEAAARAGKGNTPAKRPAPVRPEPPVQAEAAEEEAATDETPGATETGLCGHRNMSGRTCTREHGHAAKSHRYS